MGPVKKITKLSKPQNWGIFFLKIGKHPGHNWFEGGTIWGPNEVIGPQIAGP